jgi:dTDP-4-dehydrorhamnose 3,5-epimerase
MYKHWTPVEGVPGAFYRNLDSYHDGRGSLLEFWRGDEMDDLRGLGVLPMEPHMGYMSWTRVGKVRGPHEHKQQTDLFVFAGPGTFNVYLWDNSRRTPGKCVVITTGETSPKAVVVPPGVVHGYRCRWAGGAGGLVINLPNSLYKGKDKQEPVDEIRHENDAASPFVIPPVKCSISMPWPADLNDPRPGQDIRHPDTGALVGRILSFDSGAADGEIYDEKGWDAWRQSVKDQRTH